MTSDPGLLYLHLVLIKVLVAILPTLDLSMHIRQVRLADLSTNAVRCWTNVFLKSPKNNFVNQRLDMRHVVLHGHKIFRQS